jgi:hypothetical protein
MDQIEFQIPVNSKVKLKDTVDGSLYGGLACSGNQGWVRRRRRDDKFGYPQVFMEWDKNHWAFNGLEDCWTYESHFDIVEKSMEKTKEELIQEAANTFASSISQLFSGKTEEVGEEIEEPDNDHAAKVRRAFEVVADNDAILIIALQEQEGVVAPTIIRLAKDPKLEYVLNCQVSYLNAHNFDTLTREILDADKD